MARVECPHESDVVTMVYTGRWPDRAADDLVAHAATCDVCADVVTVARAIETDSAERFTPRLPSSGAVWWRAQLRARQDAAREVVRPITVAQAVGFAAAAGLGGALFGATAGWFQHAIQRMTTFAADSGSRFTLPTLPTDTAGYGAVVLICGLGLVVTSAVVAWVLKEE